MSELRTFCNISNLSSTFFFRLLLTLCKIFCAIIGHNRPTMVASSKKNVPHPKTHIRFDDPLHRTHIFGVAFASPSLATFPQHGN